MLYPTPSLPGVPETLRCSSQMAIDPFYLELSWVKCLPSFPEQTLANMFSKNGVVEWAEKAVVSVRLHEVKMQVPGVLEGLMST